MTEQSPAEAIFFAALDRATAEDRAAFLDEACGADEGLRRRVERLLAAHPQADGFLECPIVGAADLAALAAQDGSHGSDTLTGRSQDRRSLDFLAPPSRPGSLGRL